MEKKIPIAPSPIKLLGKEPAVHFPRGGFGAVLARAGVGKTSVLVQIAIGNLMEDQKVLHVSLNEPVRKVCLWYEEVFSNITARFGLQNPAETWEAIVPHRFIMTFAAEQFTVPRLAARLSDLVEQNIFAPEVIVVDGLNFDANVQQILEELHAFATEKKLRVWFAVRTHREGSDPATPLLRPFYQVAGLFDVALFLDSVGTDLVVRVLQGSKDAPKTPPFILDSTTLLIKE